MNIRSPWDTSYTVREAEDTTREEWDGWLRNSPGGGHILQGHQWGEFKRGQGWKPVRLVLEKDGEVAGMGQFLAYDTLPVPGCLMYCTKGPWLPWDDKDAVHTFFESAAKILDSKGAHTVKIEPEIPAERRDLGDLLEGIGFRKARYDLNFSSTVVMDLSPPEDEILDLMSGRSKKGKTTRYNLNLARRKGVEVFESENFDWAFETLYAWLENLFEHKEGFSSRRPREYLYDMMRALHDTGQGHFFFARHEGQPLSGAFVFTFGKKLWFMHGASETGSRKLQGTYLLQWEIMRWAKRNEITYCDMVGAPKPKDRTKDNPYYGSYEFKRGFGGDTVDFIGCLDLPIKPRSAAVWYAFEPLYYRLYFKLKHNIFY